MAEAAEVGSAFVSLIPSARGFSALVRKELRKELAGTAIVVPVDPDLDEAKVAAAARRASLIAQSQIQPIELPVAFDRRHLQQVGQQIGQIVASAAAVSLRVAGAGLIAGGIAVAIAGAASAAGAAVPALIGFGTALVATSNTLVALPGAIAVAAAGINVIKLGLAGLSDAFKAVVSGDAKAFAEALEKLSPSAREFAKALMSWRPAFEALRLATQERLLAGTAAVLNRLATNILPILEQRFTEIAAVINRGVLGAIRDLDTAANRSTLSRVLAATSRSAHNLLAALRPLGQVLLDVAGVGALLTAELTSGVGDAVTAFSRTISAMAASGELAQMFRDGLDSLKLFAGLLTDIGGILAGIGRAAGGQGNLGIFSFFDQLNAAVNSASGQQGLHAVFAGLGALGTALLPVLDALIGALGPLATAIAVVATAMAGPLTAVLDALGPAFLILAEGIVALAPSVASLASSFLPLAQILTELVVSMAPGIVTFLDGLAAGLRALVPVAPLVGQALGAVTALLGPLAAALGPVLANGLAAIVPSITRLAMAAMPLLTVLAEVAAVGADALVPVLIQMADAGMPLIDMLASGLLGALVQLVPAATELATVLSGALLAAMPQLIDIASQLIPVVVELAQVFANQLAGVLAELVPVLPDLITSGLGLALAFTRLLVALAPLLVPLVDLLSQVSLLVLQLVPLEFIVGAISTVLGIVTTAMTLFGAVVSGVISVATDALSAVSRFIEGVRGIGGSATSALANLPGIIVSALGNPGRWLYEAGRSVVNGLIEGIKSMFGNLRSAAGSLTGIIRDFLPHSPAKTGPLSGTGAPFNSGQIIAQDVAAGMLAELPKVASSADQMAALLGPDAMRSMGATPAAAGAAFELDGTGLPRALAEWFRYSVRAKGQGGTVQSAYGQN